jgi:hypothetical protein
MSDISTNAEELVSAGFVTLIAAFDRCADDVKLQCAEATMEGKLERSGALLEASKIMQAFRREVEVLSMRWSKGVFRLSTNTISEKRKNSKVDQKKIGHRHKSKNTRLRVTIAGQTLTQGSAAEIFSTALERMGLERVAKLDIRCSGIALVSRNPATSYQSQKIKDDWYITTHANNPDKKHILEAVGAELQIPVRVDIDS